MANEPGKKPALSTKKHVARLQREQQQSRMILYIFIGILATVILLLVYGFLDIKYFQLQRPVAKVGDTEILASEFEPRVRLQRQQLLGQYNQYAQYAQFFGMDVTAQLQQIESALNSPVSIGESVLNQMVNEEIIRQEAAKRGITVDEDELNEMMQSAFAYYPNGTPTPSATATELVMPEPPAEAFELVTKTPIPSPTSEFTATVSAESTDADTSTLTTGTPEATASLVPSATPTATLEPTVTPTSGPTSTPEPTATPYTLQGYQTEVASADETLSDLGFEKDVYRSLFEIQILER